MNFQEMDMFMYLGFVLGAIMWVVQVAQSLAAAAFFEAFLGFILPPFAIALFIARQFFGF